jgi:hypothetical protein
LGARRGRDWRGGRGGGRGSGGGLGVGVSPAPTRTARLRGRVAEIATLEPVLGAHLGAGGVPVAVELEGWLVLT